MTEGTYKSWSRAIHTSIRRAMQENQTEDPKIIYEEHLRVINGIKFTPREIDVASCLAAGKDASTTAFLLNISPRTVENNLSGMRKKLDCGSSQAILKFMEKSGKLSWLHKYYLGISGQSVPENLNLNLTHKESSFIANYFQKFLNLSIYMKVVTIITSMGFFGFCLWALALGGISVTSPTKELPIRSELKIPAESGFLDRKELIKKIEDKLKGNQGIERVALVGVVGIGGAGKTTLARQYGLLQNASVVWEINAETKENLMNSFRELAQKLAKTKEKKESLDFIQAIQNPDEREKHLLSLIKDWLRERSNWVLIYDNVESLAEMKTYFPEDAKVWGKGRVIITTRDKNIENTSYVHPETIINIEELSEKEKLSLFSKIIFNCESDNLTQNQKEEATNFLKNLPPFPLDISLAAYYIKNNKMSYNEYLRRIEENSKDFDKNQISILKKVSNYDKTRYGIIALSFQKMIESNPEFKELLFFICLLDSQNIPENLLNSYASEDVVRDFIYHLRKQSFILEESLQSNKETRDVFSIHRSTQEMGLFFIFNTLNKNEKKVLINKIIVALNLFYQKKIKKQCPNINIFIPHLEVLLKKHEKFDLLNEKNKEIIITIMSDVCHYLGNFIQEQNWLLKLSSSTYSKKTLKSANILNKLCRIHLILSQSRKELIKASAFCEKSIKVATVMDISNNKRNLLISESLQLQGVVNRKSNNFKEAINHFKKALRVISKIDSTEKDVIESEVYEQIGTLFSVTYLNKKPETLEYMQKALQVLDIPEFFKSSQKKIDKPKCYAAKHKLRYGEAYCRLGEYKKAREQFEDAVYIVKNKLDACTNETSQYQINIGLAQVFLRQGNLQAAEIEVEIPAEKIAVVAGIYHSIEPKMIRAEIKLRRNKLEEAYKDCSFIMNLQFIVERENFVNLLCITAFYHAAIIKYKQNDFKKSAEHFSDFFKQMKDFCKGFLEEPEYKDLESKGVFAEIDLIKIPTKEDMKQYLKRSTQIFTTIYGPKHPFVADYVMQNEQDNLVFVFD